MHVTFKLLTFNCYDKKCISDNDSGSKDGFKSDQEYLVQMFGINESGRTASIFVKGFKPFFYVKVPLSWKEQNKSMFISKLRDEMGDYYEDSIIGAKLIKRRKLYGFDGGVDHNFVMIEFESEISMKKAKKLWYTYQGGNQHLIPGGYDFGGDGLELYEGNIPPLLRLFHINNISPSGWVALPNKKTMRHKKYQKSTICDYEFTIQYKDIIPLPDKETLVPYKICSFDIEASSSHGDFPLPKKTYKKLAQNIINHWDDLSDDNKTDKYLRMIIDGAFQIKPYQMDGIDIVYPKRAISEDELEKLFLRWKTTKIEEIQKGEEEMNYFQQEDVEIEGGDEGFVEQDGANESGGFKKFEPKQKYKKRGTIMNILNDSESAKDLRIEKLKDSMDNIFPQLKGDEVTFIGSTFLHYGQEKPYLNHCAVKGECSDLPQVENSEIECFSSEKKLLVGWSKLIQKHNPDIIISYNGFGFDFEFMYVRAKELGCATKFMECSRNKGESCTSKKWNRETNQEETGLETNSIFLATGQYDIKYMKMNGRLLIDLYNCFRRDFQLIKYKLDYVASYFIGDKVSKLEHHDGKTKIFSKNLTGLEEESYVTFEEEAHSVDLYKEGQKFIVRNLNQEEGSFWIDSLEQPDMSKKVRWGLAKDDVTPQDIFRMTNEGPDQKAIIAKYCIQDCNLVHHLLRKVDFITGFVEMASLCSVPMEFLVLRGQGIKLTSYISKKCREKGILMPTIEKSMNDESYEGAIVLPPKCNLYLDEAVACVDYSSLYPSSMISENISHDSKVWTKEYDLDDNLVRETGDKDEEGEYIYDNMDGYEYVDIKYDTYKWRRKNNNPKAAMEKVCVGYKICRFAQFPEGGRAVMPSILEELLAARKATRKLIPLQKDAFMKNILDKRQLSIKMTANSLYGQTGAKTSTFYEVDCAASTTAIGRKLLTYARRVIEEAYKNVEVETKCHGKIKVDAEYVYGDSVTGDTPLLLKNIETDEIEIKQIDEVYDTWENYDMFKAGESNRKEKQQSLINNYLIYTSNGWSKIVRTIRHKTEKDIYRVTTHTGMADVTEDHSLLDENKKILKPTEVEEGMRLLHNYPAMNADDSFKIGLSYIRKYIDEIEGKTIDEKEAFLYGFFFGDGSCGKYQCLSGLKYSWALNQKNREFCEKLKNLCCEVHDQEFKILDTIESSGVYKIVPVGQIKKMVNLYRELCYNKDKYKIIPTRFLNEDINIKMAYCMGYYAADGAKCDNQISKNITLSNKGKIGTSMLFYMFRSIGLEISLNTRSDKLDIFKLTATSNKQRKPSNILKKIEQIGNSKGQYVYDIETETGNFNTGFALIVKNTDSVFFKFNPTTLEGEQIKGQKALEVTIELAQEAGELATKFLKKPHDLEYEKTFWPFCLLSKKRYVGMLYEMDPHKCSRKSMGIVLKRRDNAPIVKDIYGGVIDILMKDRDIEKALAFLRECLRNMIEEKYDMVKLVITKSLRGEYKNPKTIAHKVLADRIGKRDPGNKPSVGDRVAFV